LDYIENKIDFYDWYNIHTGESYHSVNVTHLEKDYGALDNVYHVNGLDGEVFLTTENYLLNYVVDDKKQTSPGEVNMVLNMTRLLDANPTVLNQCSLSEPLSSSYSWEFKNIKVINNTETNSAYLYGSWYSSCLAPRDQTESHSNPYLSSNSSMTISESIMFSCKIDSRRKELDPNACTVMNSAGETNNSSNIQDSTHITDWITFVDLTAPKITPTDCNEQPALKSEGITCEYFCALEPYKGREAHCVCPLGQTWDEVNQKCTEIEKYKIAKLNSYFEIEKCEKTCTADGKKLCLTNEMLCDGNADCDDGSDESLASGCSKEQILIGDGSGESSAFNLL